MNHTHLYPALFRISNGHRHLGVPVGVVHGAVDRVDNPQRCVQLLGLAEIRHGFFRQNSVIGKPFADGVGDQFVCHHIRMGDQLGLLLVVGFQAVLITFPFDQITRLPGE